MADKNAKAGKAPAEVNASNGANIALAALAVVLVFAGLVYFSSQQGQAPGPNVPAAGGAVEAEAKSLLLGSFDRMAEMESYELMQTSNESTAVTKYTLMKNGSLSFIKVEEPGVSLYGFFGGENLSDVICLNYSTVVRCAPTTGDTKMAEIGGSLTALLPVKEAYLSQKTGTEKMIASGAMTFIGMTDGGVVIGHDTTKITYKLDYTTLTVQQLLSIGVSPNDDALKSLTNQIFAFWIDKKTGLMVKNSYTYEVKGQRGFSESEYTKISTVPPIMPGRPVNLASQAAFLSFYQESIENYGKVSACNSKSGAARDDCYKSLAYEKSDWELCKLISDKNKHEVCTLVVAQNTNNHVLCGKLEALADECYIAVVGQTGNAEICRNIKNASLVQSCAEAAASGQKIQDAKKAEAERKMSLRNCAASSDCKAFGNYNQFCLPKNSTPGIGGTWEPAFSCFANLTCGCNEGFCGFGKNETYYKCISDVDEEYIRKYVGELSVKNQTNSTLG